MARVIIVHGYNGNPGANWFPWLKNELEKLGVEVTVPQMPNPDTPQLHEWLSTLRNVVGTPDNDTYLVGHSLGCPTILRYLQSLKEGEFVGGALLVAGFAEPHPDMPELDSFTSEYWDDEHIRRSSNLITLISSDNDPRVPLEAGRRMSQRFSAKLTILHDAGHINEKSGHLQVPEILTELRRMINI